MSLSTRESRGRGTDRGFVQAGVTPSVIAGGGISTRPGKRALSTTIGPPGTEFTAGRRRHSQLLDRHVVNLGAHPSRHKHYLGPRGAGCGKRARIGAPLFRMFGPVTPVSFVAAAESVIVGRPGPAPDPPAPAAGPGRDRPAGRVGPQGHEGQFHPHDQ
ncbi:hypothetical protein GCM10010519_08740 [Streptomyces lactacystinicus]